jgi:BASS family bile acid:Na+ symporter
MTLQQLIGLVLRASIALLVFSIGLGAQPSDLVHLFRRPRLLARSLLAMYGVMPLLALALALTFPMHPAIKLALVTLAVSPVPPALPRKQLKAAAEEASYIVGLLVVAGLAAVVVVPIWVSLLGRVAGRATQMSPGAVARVVLATVLVPLVLGMLLRRLAPALVERVRYPISLTANVLLLLGSIPLLLAVAPAMGSLIGNGTILVLVVFVAVGLAAGHLLGGPILAERTVLALATAARHPGVALAIATANAPTQKLAPAALLLYLLVSAIGAMPYLAWVRHHARPLPGAQQTSAS